VPASLLSSLFPYQRVNHFPGMYAIARKSNLCMNLNRLRSALPEDFAFYPRTWFLPAEFRDFEESARQNPRCFIVKPAASSQGRGIFLVQTAAELALIGDCVVQEYVENPLLIEGLKFDMRVYVLVTGCDPLRIFLHSEGLVRLATEKYSRPSTSNLSKVCMHLTNYSLNKHNPKFVKNKSANEDLVGHKRSLKSVLCELEKKGYPVEEMWTKVKDIVVKTLCSVQPALAHTYRSCRPSDASNAMCFELLGFDILLDSRCRPVLLEVNHSPSFETSTPLDRKIKGTVIRDTILMLNLDKTDKAVFEQKNRAKIEERSVFRRSFHEKMNEFQREREEIGIERDEYEAMHLGGFTRIFPSKTDYASILSLSQAQLARFTGARRLLPRPKTSARPSSTPPPSCPRTSSSRVRPCPRC
jgi:tubulin polyglutamylase TTLL6/13